MTFEKPMTIEETKATELGILRELDKFCAEYSLEYFLAYGTLIGAVRHSGFIPWDDDIDVQMPREDYNKLIELFKEKSNTPYLRIIAPADSDAEHTYAKLVDTRTVKVEGGHIYKTDDDYRGIDIDIFPLDGQPDDEGEYKKWYGKLRKIYRKIWMSELEITPDLKTSFKFAIRVFKLLRIFFPKREKLLAKAAKLHALYPYSESKYVGCVESYFNGIGNRNPKTSYESTVLLDFEGEKFKAPKDYHGILTRMYGDYMKLPPKEAQVTHHTNHNYRRD